jgi:hypothetical protein
MPLKVDSDDEGSDSSDEDIDGKFTQKAFQQPCEYFRLYPHSSKDGKRSKKTYRGTLILPPLLPQPAQPAQPASETKIRKIRKNSRFASLLPLFEEEVKSINSTSPNRFAISVGFNKMRSLSQRRNDSLKRCLNEPLNTQIHIEKIGFLWDGIWQKKVGQGEWKTTNYKEVRCFYRQLKRKNPDLAQEFRKTTEKNRAHMVPYREIRDAIKNHEHTKEFTRQYRIRDLSCDVYIVFLDSDLKSFHHQEGAPSMFSIFDKKYSENKFEIASTGYTIREPENRVLELGVLADLKVREGTAKYIRRGVYYPEPCTAVKIPAGKETIPEDFSDPNDKNYQSPMEMPRLIAEVLNRLSCEKPEKSKHLIAQEVMVFDAQGAIVTATPTRMRRRFACHLTQRNGIILWNLADFKTMRGINQSHFNPNKWAKNMLPALAIVQQFKIGKYILKDRKVIQDVVISLLSRLFNAFDPIELAQRVSEKEESPFQICLINILEDYNSKLTDELPSIKKKRKVRKNAKNMGIELKKCRAVNKLWKRADGLKTVTSFKQELKTLLTEDCTSNLIKAAKESGKNLVTLFKSKLCLNYKELVIHNLANLINITEKKPLKEIPNLYSMIIEGNYEKIFNTQFNFKEDFKKELLELGSEEFYGITALHIAALAGNLKVVEKLINEGRFQIDSKDDKGLIPFDYALAHCQNNGINFKLLETLCGESIAELIQERVSNSLDDNFDKAWLLDQFLTRFGSNVVQKFEKNIFIQAIEKDYEILANELRSIDKDQAQEVLRQAILDRAPDFDEDLIKFATPEDIRWVKNQLNEDDLSLFNKFCNISEAIGLTKEEGSESSDESEIATEISEAFENLYDSENESSDNEKEEPLIYES